jgi:hypothetical protein
MQTKSRLGFIPYVLATTALSAFVSLSSCGGGRSGTETAATTTSSAAPASSTSGSPAASSPASPPGTASLPPLQGFKASGLGVTAPPTPDNPAYSQDLPPPTVNVLGDDHNAVLVWGIDQPDRQDGNGYQVTWGPKSAPASFVKLTSFHQVQLQPLVNVEDGGGDYVAVVRAVSTYGKLSAPSTPVTFHGTSARIDTLARQFQSGFVERFNQPAGLWDERKINTAYSACNDPNLNGAFVNSQFHAHNTVGSFYCDRASTFMRFRMPIYFTDNGVRTIIWSQDSPYRRSSGYMELRPYASDTEDVVTLNGADRTPAGGTLRLTTANTGVGFEFFAPDGTRAFLPSAVDPKTPAQADLAWMDRLPAPNVRRTYEMKVSRSQAVLYVDGRKVLETAPGAIKLTSDKYQLGWDTFSYNTPKDNQTMQLWHMGAIFYDTAPGTEPFTVTHNYRLTHGGNDYLETAGNAAATVKLTIPDAVTGAVSRRLLFTEQIRSSNFRGAWSASDHVVVNGRSFAWPDSWRLTATPPWKLTELVGLAPYQQTIDLPEGVLIRGENAVQFVSNGFTGVHNIHAELDFSKGSEPSYTQPDKVMSASGLPLPGKIFPATPDTGAGVFLSQIDSTNMGCWGKDTSDPAQCSATVKGTAQVLFDVSTDAMMSASGANDGILEVGILVDGLVAVKRSAAIDTPAAGGGYSLPLDVSSLAEGIHEIYVYACTSKGIANMNEGQHISYARTGIYQPFLMNVANRSGSTARFSAKADPGLNEHCRRLPGVSAVMAAKAHHGSAAVDAHSH